MHLITHADIARRSAAAPEPWIEPTGDGLRLAGDDTGRQIRYIHAGPAGVRVTTDVRLLLDALTSENALPPLDPHAVSHMLHHAVVPLPLTPFRGIHALGLGGRAELSADDGAIHVRIVNTYPYLYKKSRGDRQPDTRRLLDLLTAATARQIEGHPHGFLMLSSGMDSTALALALAETGRKDFSCATFVADAADDEHVRAAALCRRLGLQHRVVAFEDEGGRLEESLSEYFASSPLPCGDTAQMAYLLCVAAAGRAGGAVLDGIGNDTYMGDLPIGHDRMKLRLYLRNRHVARFVTARIGPDSALNYFLRGRAGAIVSGRTLRHCDTRLFYSESVDTLSWWNDLAEPWRRLDDIDFLPPILLHAEQPKDMLKGKQVVEYLGQSQAVPFCDDDFIDYYFNLPEAARFDRRSMATKLHLTEMLERFADYDARAVGKRVFKFDAARFLVRHRRFVREQIVGCTLWGGTIERQADRWLDEVERRPFLSQALMPLLFLSGWHNHSRFIRR